MIYVDTSVLLARLFAEEPRPKEAFWHGSLVSSQLIEIEAWTRLHRERKAAALGPTLKALLLHMSLIDLTPEVLRRASEAFPGPVRSLDAIHLSTLHYLHGQGFEVILATYDKRMAEAAKGMGLPLADLK